MDTVDKSFILKGRRRRDQEALTVSLEKVRSFPYFSPSTTEGEEGNTII